MESNKALRVLAKYSQGAALITRSEVLAAATTIVKENRKLKKELEKYNSSSAVKTSDRLITKYNDENILLKLCSVDRLGGIDDCLSWEDICEQNIGQCEGCPVQKCFDKLAKYENTGLEPNQIKEIDKLYLEKCEEVNALTKKLEELTGTPRGKRADEALIRNTFEQILNEETKPKLNTSAAGSHIIHEAFSHQRVRGKR